MVSLIMCYTWKISYFSFCWREEGGRGKREGREEGREGEKRGEEEREGATSGNHSIQMTEKCVPTTESLATFGIIAYERIKRFLCIQIWISECSHPFFLFPYLSF